MKKLKENLIEIAQKQRGLLLMMILLLVMGVVLLIFSLLSLGGSRAAMNVGYGDIGGYRAGGTIDMLAFPVLAVILGVVHNFLAVRLYTARGAGWAQVLVAGSIVLIIATFMVLGRLLGEG